MRAKRSEMVISTSERITEKDVLSYYVKNLGDVTITINNKIELLPDQDINLAGSDPYPEDVDDDYRFAEGNGTRKVLIMMRQLKPEPVPGAVNQNDC